MRNVLVISSSEWPVAALRAALGDDIDELRVGSVAAIVAYVVIGSVVVAGARQSGGAEGALRVAIWVIAAFFLLGAGGNLASKSRSERFVMAPVSGLLGALTLVVAAGS